MMFETDLEQYFRVLSLLAMSGVIAFGTATMILRRHRTIRRIRRIVMWAFLILCCIAYGTGANVAAGVPVPLAAKIIGFLFIGLLLALVWHPEGDMQYPPHDNSFGQKVIDAIERLKK